jgi:outer membrane lipoprotein SlyB
MVATLAAMLATAGCSRHTAVPAAAAAPPRPDTHYGIIAAMRPANIVGRDARGTILRLIGAAAAPDGDAMEFIVRVDDGDTISVVQADTQRLRPGERVEVTASAPTRLVRPLARSVATTATGG